MGELRVEEKQVSLFPWKNSRYSSSYRRATCNVLAIRKLEVFCTYRKAVCILLRVEDLRVAALQVFFFL